MKAPDKIYINGFSAFATMPEKNSIEYIRKDALLEWAKERDAETRDKAGTDGVVCAYHNAIMDLIEKIESL